MINASKDKNDKSEDKSGELTYEDYKNRGLSSQGLISRVDTILGETTLSKLGLAPFSHLRVTICDFLFAFLHSGCLLRKGLLYEERIYTQWEKILSS